MVSYLSMLFLLALQYYSNKKLSQLQFSLYQISDSRIQYLSQVLNGIKQIKLNLWERVFSDKINTIREQELTLFSKYINIKNVCSAIYANASILISSMIFLMADKSTLELGKVFSTLALLGYIFNFSILYSNYAIESIYCLRVFDRRIREVIESVLRGKEIKDHVEATLVDEDYDIQTGRSLSTTTTGIKLDNVYSQWTMHEDKDTGEDIDNEANNIEHQA